MRTKTSKAELQERIKEEVQSVLDRIHNARPTPALEALDVPFNPMLVACQAPSRRKRQCSRKATRISRITYAEADGVPRPHYHDTCWQHTEHEVKARPGQPKLKIVRGGKR